MLRFMLLMPSRAHASYFSYVFPPPFLFPLTTAQQF